MSDHPFLVTAAIGTGTIALLAAIWQYVRIVFSYISGLIIVTNRVEAANLSHTLLTYLVTRSKRRWHLGGRVFASFNAYVTPLGRQTRIAVKETSSSTNLFLLGWIPILAIGGDEDDGYKPVNFSYVRGTVNWLKLTKVAIDLEDDSQDEEKQPTNGQRYRIVKMAGGRGQMMGGKDGEGAEGAESSNRVQRRPGIELLHWKWEDLGTPEPPCALDKMSLDAEQLDFIDEVKFWKGLEDWCRLKGVPWHRGYLFHGIPGSGKCLGIGTPVLKFDGTVVPVEQVQTGDLLMGPDSKPRKVLGTTRSRGQLHRIVPIKGEPWVCNDVHVLTLVASHSSKVVDVPINEYLQWSEPSQKEHKQFGTGVDFPPQAEKLPLDPYFLGLWLGDGTKTLDDGGDLRGIGITKPDPEVVEVVDSMAAQFGLRRVTRDSNGTRCPTHFIVGEKKRPNPLLDLLRSIVGTAELIPQQYLTASREDRLQLLAGLLDSDGHMHLGGFEFAQKRKGLADGAAFLARSLGLKVTRSIKTVDGTDYQRLMISGDCSVIPNRIPRKKADPRQQVKDALRTGIAVESIGEGEYAGFELDGDGRFLLGDFTVTHNTSLTRALAEYIDFPVFAMDLASMGNGDLTRAWSKAVKSAPCIVLIEDIDAVFDKRQNLTGEDGVTFDCLLNCIDGIEATFGVMTIITTNYIEKVDPALACIPTHKGARKTLSEGGADEDDIPSRPGRIDRLVHFSILNEEGRLKMAQRILDDEADVQKVMLVGKNDAAAQFQERCFRRAMARKFHAYYAKKPPVTTGSAG